MEKEQFREFEKLRQHLRAIPYREHAIIFPYFFAASVFIVLAILLIIWQVLLAISMIILGVIIGIYGYILQNQEIENYSFYGVNREDMTKAIEFMDSFGVSEDELESPVLYHNNKPRGKYEMYGLYQGLIVFMKKLGSKVSWSLDLDKEIRASISQERKNVLKIILLYLVIDIIFLAPSVLFGFAYFLLMIIPITYSWIKRVYNERGETKEDWLDDIIFSEDQKLSDTIHSFLNLLYAEYHYPLRLFLNKKYSQLIYTGRTKTTDTLIYLKEAIFYPQRATQNIE